MPLMRYEKPAPGEWFRLGGTMSKGNRNRCCDCGLTHVFDLRVHRGQVYVRMRRDNDATRKKRRRDGIQVSRGRG